MENETTLPARLTQPDALGTDGPGQSGFTIVRLIFFGLLLALVAVAYFV